MIDVASALNKVTASEPSLRTVNKKVASALCGSVLAKDIYAPIALPPFNQSAMDGYALCMHSKNTYTVIGEIPAGSAAKIHLQPGEAVRIFTGAMVPPTADVVVIQEKVTHEGDLLHAPNEIHAGQNIRQRGNQVKKGTLVLSKNTVITPATLGLIQSLGISSVEVFRKPRVAILVTGNELVAVGTPLTEGKVYESNSLILQTALQQFGIEEIEIFYAEDTAKATEEAIAKTLQFDIVLISGGVSVGDYDFVGASLAAMEVETSFYKVRQKPGKPLFFGHKEHTFVFALPGNPASTLNCFYIYVVPLLFKFLGKMPCHLPIKELELESAVENNFKRALFLKALAKTNSVAIIDELNSATLLSFTKANALVYVPEDVQFLEKGTRVKTWILPD